MNLLGSRGTFYQEGLPDYWGIETIHFRTYLHELFSHQEGLPDYWGIETCPIISLARLKSYQEGLPDYWGIETFPAIRGWFHSWSYQEGLPDYWGIETNPDLCHHQEPGC